MSSYRQLLYHLVFRTKNSIPSIGLDNAEQLYAYISGIIRNNSSHLYCINGTENHIHILTDLHPSVALADFMRELKASTSKWVKEKGLFPFFEGWEEVVGLKVKTELKGCFNLPLKEDFYLINNDSSLYFLIDFKIINESEQTIEFITYSCTSVENLLVDNKSVRIVINRCSGNGPMIVELRPKQEFSLPVIIQTNIRNAFTYVNVGFNYYLLSDHWLTNISYLS